MRCIVAIVLLTACSAAPDAPRADTLSRRERDSVIGASSLPGASGVRGANAAADSAQARRAREAAATDAP